MAKTLFIFLFSPQVDPYINAIAYTRREMKIDAVKLVYVKGAKTGLDNEKASTIFNQIWTKIESLKNEAEIYKEINEKLLNRELMPIEYSDLKIRFGQVVKKQGSLRNCIVDITGATKVAGIDVFSICLALGLKSIYSFELIKNRDTKASGYNPNNFLYHALKEHDYSYTCLSETIAVKSSQSSLLRKSALLWYVVTVSSLVLIVSLYLLSTLGSDNAMIQGLNIAAAVVGLISPIVALAEQRQKNE
jgi:hypothetical protein